MLDQEGIVVRLVARVQALLPNDWFSRSGRRFRAATHSISEFLDEHRIAPKDLLEEAVELGHTKIEGLANKEFAEAAKNFAEAEQTIIDAELQRRSLESKVRKEEAEARIAELRALDAEINLLQRLKEIGVVIQRDAKGNLTVLPAPRDCDLLVIADRKLKAGESQIVGQSVPPTDAV